MRISYISDTKYIRGAHKKKKLNTLNIARDRGPSIIGPFKRNSKENVLKILF